MATGAVFLLIFGGIYLHGWRRIPADPPHKGQVTIFGKRLEGVFLDEGWHWLLLPGLVDGFILIEVKKISFVVTSATTRTPDGAMSKVPVNVVIRPADKFLMNYQNSGGEQGVTVILTHTIEGRVREWADGDQEGPTTWQELNQSRMEAVIILAKKIVGDQLPQVPSFAQHVPTWIWLRFFAKPRPTAHKCLTNEKFWMENNWEKVQDVLRQIKADHGKPGLVMLKQAVDKRREEIEKLISGKGKIVIESLGVTLEQLNLGDIDVLGEVAKKADAAAKEELDKASEEKELTHMAKRINKMKKKESEGGAELSQAEAIEQVDLSTGKATKTIQEHKVTIDPAVVKMFEGFLAAVAKIFEKKP